MNDLALISGHHSERVATIIKEARAASFKQRRIDASLYPQFYVAIYRLFHDGHTSHAVFHHRLYEQEPEQYQHDIAAMVANIRQTGNHFQFGDHCLMIPASGGGAWYIDYCDHFVPIPGAASYNHGRGLPLLLALKLGVISRELCDEASHCLHDSDTDQLVGYDRFTQAHRFIRPGGGTCAS